MRACDFEQRVLAGSNDEAVRRHLGSCAACREGLRVQEAMRLEVELLVRDAVVPHASWLLWRSKLQRTSARADRAGWPAQVAEACTLVVVLVLLAVSVASAGRIGREGAVALGATGAAAIAVAIVWWRAMAQWRRELQGRRR